MKEVSISYSRPIYLLAFALLGCCGGCDIIAGLASMSPPKDQPALYKGLAHQSTGVMVWVSRGPAVDFPDLQGQIASGVNARLTEAKADELSGTSFINPISIMRFQMDHPEVEAEPVQDVAPRLGVSRLIYIEVEDFETRAHESIDRYLGNVVADVSVVEVTNGVGKITYHERGVREIYPKSTPEGVEADDGGDDVRRRTIKQFTQDVAERFYAHPAPDESPENHEH